MKATTLTIICLTLILSTGKSALVNSLPLNYSVLALLNGNERFYYPVDVDLDGTYDVFFYADISLLVQAQGQADPSHLRLVTANEVYVSCFNVPIGSEEQPASVAAFTTFAESETIGSDLNPPDWSHDPLWTWESGDLPFHGFKIAGGIPSRDSYLGVKIIKESNEYFGWIRLIFPISYDYFDQTGYVKIKESSHETTPSTPLVAGFGRTEIPSRFLNSIKLTNTGNLELKINEVNDLVCMLQESSDLSNWDTVTVEYSTESKFTKVVSKDNPLKFYRWQVTENLEEIN